VLALWVMRWKDQQTRREVREGLGYYLVEGGMAVEGGRKPSMRALSTHTFLYPKASQVKLSKMPSTPNAAQPQFLEHACDATRILSKRRQLHDIKERVATEKENFDRQNLILQQKIDELTKRELDFQAKVRDLDLHEFCLSTSSKHSA
jgi:hypothetical protein